MTTTRAIDEWLPVAHGSPPPRRSAAWRVVAAGIAAIAAAAMSLGAVMVVAGRLPPGMTVAGERVGSRADAAAAAEAAAEAVSDMDVVLVSPAGHRVNLAADSAGLMVDAAATIERLDRRAIASAWLRRAIGRPTAVPPTFDAAPARALDAAARALSVEPVDASVSTQGATPRIVAPQDGVRVTGEGVRTAVLDALAQLDGPPRTWPTVLEVSVDGAPVASAITEADAAEAVQQIEDLAGSDVRVSAPHVAGDAAAPLDNAGGSLGADTGELVLGRSHLQALVTVAPRPGAPAGERLEVVADASGLPTALVGFFGAADLPPTVDAEVVGASAPPGADDAVEDVSAIHGDVVIRGSSGGFRVDRLATVAAIVDTARRGGGSVAVVGGPPEEVDPSELGIAEPVSTFTTFYPAGQSRVQNIHRIAEIVDGIVIPAGAPFELNDAVGERTRENGFTLGGAILDGELVSAIGGGVSQFATTFLNAGWFSGIELVEFHPHSRYFDRYPAGREATVNYPNVDLEVRNDTPYAILVDTAITDTSVTVTFWSTPYWQVETVTGPRSNGGSSFRITVDRIRTAPDGATTRDSYTTLYQPAL